MVVEQSKTNNSKTISNKRWAAYATAGVAAVLAGSQTAEADITYVAVGSGDPQGTWGSNDDFYFALDGSAMLNFYHPGGGALVGVFNGGLQGSIVGFSSGFNYASNLAAGVNISTQGFLNAFATMAYGPGYSNSQFSNQSGYLGFNFDAGAGTQYGWARVTAANDAPINTFTIEEYAYGDVGEQVAVGQVSSVPEPTSLGLLALGALGVVAGRRRRKVA